jgi:hypothetical protein
VLPRVRELRRSPRIPKRQGAAIAEAGLAAPMPCTIWDISEHGARLAAPHPKSLPATFTLIMKNGGVSRRYCRVAWRSSAYVGVKFVDRPDEEIPSRSFRSTAPQSPASNSVPSTELRNARDSCRAELVSLQKMSPKIGGATQSSSRSRGSNGLAFCAATLVGLLVAATGIFYFASLHVGSDEAGWTNDVCATANNFCQHPEITGVSAFLVIFIFMAAKGMERD